MPCLPHDSILIWLNHFICGIHTTHEVTRCRAPFSRSKVKGRSIFLPCPLCSSVPISLIHFIWDTCTTHEVTMCCAPFPNQKNKGQGHRSHLNFVMSVVSCLFDRITSYMAYIQHMRGRCVVHHFQDERSKVKVIWIFRFFNVSSMQLHPYFTDSAHMIYTQPMRSQCVVHNFQVEMSKVMVTRMIWSVCSMASSLFDKIMSYVSYTQHMRMQCVASHFQDERSKVKATRVTSNVTYRHVSQRQPIKGQCVVRHFQIKDQGHTDRYKFCHVFSVMEQIELPSVCLCPFHWFTFLCTNFHG